ncbi:MAG: hypothetical protein H0U75_11445 [Legionella sp.]|nr:hypothetical protein [Legionella sp.]
MTTEAIENFNNHIKKLFRSPVKNTQATQLTAESVAPMLKALACIFEVKPPFGNEMVIDFLQALCRSPALQEMVYFPLKPGMDSLLHQLVRHQYIKALIYYLEQPCLKVIHRNSAGQTAYGLATISANPTMLYLFQAQSTVHALLEPSDQSIITVQAQLKKYPNILSTRWSKGCSLAHIASVNKKPEILKIFLEQGTNSNLQDEQGFTVLDYALAENDVMNIQTIVRQSDDALFQAATAIHYLKKKLDLLECPETGTLETDQLISFLFSIKPAILLTFIKLLNLSHSHRKSLDMVLCKGQVLPFVYKTQSLEDHFLIERCFTTPAKSLASIASVHFRQTALTALSPALLTHYSNSLDESSLYKLAINRAVPALIVLSLERILKRSAENTPQVQLLWKMLEKKLVQFCKGIPEDMCNDFGLMLNLTQHIEIKKFIIDHLSPASHFFSKAVKQRLNSSETKGELQRNPVGLPQLESTASVIDENCEQLFSTFQRGYPLLRDSLLEALFLGFGHDEIVQKIQHHQAFSWLLTYAQVDEVKAIIEAQLNNQAGDKDLRQAFHHVLIQGLIENPNLPNLMPVLFQWAITKGLASCLLEYLPKLLHTLTDWQTIDDSLEEVLKLHSQTHLCLMDLKVHCLESSFSLQDFAKLAQSWEEEQLEQICYLCEKTEALALRELLQTIQYALTNDAPLPIFEGNVPLIILESLDSLSVHQSQITSLKALKEGIYVEGCDAVIKLQHFSYLLHKTPGHLNPEAIPILIQSYLPVLKRETPPHRQSNAFIHTLALLMSQSTPKVQSNIIQTMPEDTLKTLLALSLSGLHSDDTLRAQACSTMLTYFAHHHVCNNKANERIILENLGHQDVSFLQDDTLIQLAQSILSKPVKDLDEATIHGIWIIRLLTSPLFVAACTPDMIRLLIELLRIIILTLKQNEFESLSRFLNHNLNFEEFGVQMVIWRNKLLNDPHRKAHLEDKRLGLLEFRADHSIGELIRQSSAAIEKTEPQLAKKANKTLNTYLNQQLSKHCSNHLLLKITNFLYSWTTGFGDIPSAQHYLFQWMKAYLPYESFEQQEFAKKNHHTLYNELGDIIGFIDEIGQARTPNNELLINQPGVKPGIDFFDDKNQKIGELTSTGTVARFNLFQKNTSALILGTVPMDELMKSPSTVKLLLHDVLIGEEINTLYACEDLDKGTNKRQWVESELNQQLVQSMLTVPAQAFQQILAHHQPNMWILLSQFKNPANAIALFHEILNDPDNRSALFQSPNAQFSMFLKQVGIGVVLASYLQNQYDKPWYAVGLSLFAEHLKISKQPHALTYAIISLGQAYDIKLLSKKTYQGVMLSFLKSEAMAKTLLNEFLGDSKGYIQDALSEVAWHFSSLFSKNDLIPCIEALNQEQAHWGISSRYRLLLIIFAAHHTTLFSAQEYRYSKHAWSENDINQLATFVSQHLIQKQNPDRHLEIGGQLLGKLVFPAANFGLATPQSALFYDNHKQFNSHIAGFMLKKSAFETFRSTIEKALTTPLKNIQQYFNPGPRSLTQFLEQHNAIIDWEKIIENTWAVNQGRDLPLFCAFLINYIGPAKPLEQLLDSFITDPELLCDRKYVYSVSKLLTQIPNRDISAHIFASLVRNPECIDATILSHMAYFYQKTHLKSKHPVDSLQSSLDLIRYFGQQQEYTLAIKCCSVLQDQDPKISIQQKLKKIQQEATVEKDLKSHSQSWYFKILCFLKRLWHYHKHPSDYVCYCDKKATYPPLKIPTDIGKAEQGGQQIEQGKKQLENAQKLSKYKSKPFELKTPVTQMGLFNMKGEKHICPIEKEGFQYTLGK